jgi:hypothetical protein
MPKKATDRKPFVDLLKNKLIKKVCQNMKFEHMWSKEILNTTVKGWYWDTMLISHYLDNRTLQTTGLKFQTYVKFGVIDYSSKVEKALQAPESNEHNSLRQFVKSAKNRQEVLRYNALDSIFTYRLFKLQETLLNQL